MVSMLITNYEMHVEVQGQVNGGVRSGTDARKLAERRAKAVCEFMQERGVDPLRMKYTGLGSEKMLFPSDGPKGFLNRRVDVLVTEPHQPHQ
jgi:outer membrane protein OmpA-like peptidoglycan-associated protein